MFLFFLLFQASCLLYKHNIEFNSFMNLSVCRSMAQYAGMCNGGSPEDGYRAVSQDATTSNAIYVVSKNLSLPERGKTLMWLDLSALEVIRKHDHGP